MSTTEPSKMQTRQLLIVFHTPAFLGDANQSGHWRTPPFKAQLRQWWRVAYAAQQGFAVNIREMRELEGALFGHAWLKNDTFERDSQQVKTAARKSLVRIRLSQWSEGKERSWSSPDTSVEHPNVHHRDGRRKPIGAQLYMGYGPLIFENGTALKANAAIQATEQAELDIAFPAEHASTVEHALQLMHLYGAVGGRSRNGWGSYSLQPANGLAAPPANPTPSQPLATCLRMDWPYALGADQQGLLAWQTKPHKDWSALMKTLAETKIGMRTLFGFNSGKSAVPEDRHWLSYPVTNHSVTSWGNNDRLPNQLRFKVRPTADGQLVGVIFHMPHLPPTNFKPDPKTLERIWQRVHSHLDQIRPALPRITA